MVGKAVISVEHLRQM